MIAVTVKAENMKELAEKVADLHQKLNYTTNSTLGDWTPGGGLVDDSISVGAATPTVATTAVPSVEPTIAPVETNTVPTAEPVDVKAVPAAEHVATVPTAPVKEFTIEEIQVAMQPLMDAGRTAEIVGLMQKYGVSALPELPKDQYTNLVVDLRAMGARI